jgi:hypothetical protein
MNVFFITANPPDLVHSSGPNQSYLDTEKEMKAVQSDIEGAKFGDVMELRIVPAASPDDLVDRLMGARGPTVVHFSGHGGVTGEIYLRDASGHSQAVSAAALDAVFAAVKDRVQLVVLNACFSIEAASTIVKHVDCAIGTTREIDDGAAIAFARGFYKSIGRGDPVQTAFTEGRLFVIANGLAPLGVPLKMLTRDGVDASQLYVIPGIDEGL